MAYNVIRNGFELVERAGTFDDAARAMARCAAVSEEILRGRYPSRTIRVSGNRNSTYVDAMSGDSIFQREFFVIEEAGS